VGKADAYFTYNVIRLTESRKVMLDEEHTLRTCTCLKKARN
jgi:hypothetical protein